MAHKTLINGTAYEISGGRTLVNGTGYSIDKGKTLVGGTVYEVGFAPTEATVTIKADGVGVGMGSYLTIDGVKYGTALSTDSYVFPVGTVISCYAKTDSDDMSGANPDYGYHSKYGNIMVNGEYVAWATHGDYDATYDYIVTENAYIELENSKGLGRVRITEIPEGHALVKITSSGIGIDPKYGYVLIDGVTYNTSSTLVIPVGTVITCFVSSVGSSYDPDWSISLNGTIIKEPDKMFPEIDCTYKYTVIGNVGIALLYNKGNCEMYITEQ